MSQVKSVNIQRTILCTFGAVRDVNVQLDILILYIYTFDYYRYKPKVLYGFYRSFKNSMMAELKTRVEELKMENEYQLRLKDMNYNEKIKELTEKFIQEMESLKTKNQVRRNEKN